MNLGNEAEVVKGGICWFELSLGRSAKGLEVWVKTVPELEDFMKGLGDGVKDNIQLYGREWLSVQQLEIYRLTKEAAVRGNVTLKKPAEPLLSIRGDETVNLSFLRLVGISNPEGVRFVIPGPYSKDYIKRASRELVEHVRSFVKDYITPVNVNLRISSQDV